MNSLLKEIGKYFYDISKITFAVAIIAPFVKQGTLAISAIVFAIITFGVGTYITYKGIKND
jgi:hypothetical protein